MIPSSRWLLAIVLLPAGLALTGCASSVVTVRPWRPAPVDISGLTRLAVVPPRGPRDITDRLHQEVYPRLK